MTAKRSTSSANHRSKPTSKRTSRVGRPSRGSQGEVDERLLKAATAEFLKRGFEATTITQIAKLAGSSKPTIYDRYADKEALFIAVAERSIAQVVNAPDLASSGSLRERLEAFGVAVLSQLLERETIDLLRVIIAEASRFPKLAFAIDQSARKQGILALAELLGQFSDGGRVSCADKANDNQLQYSEVYLTLVVLPLQMRALMGESLKVLRAEVTAHVAVQTHIFLSTAHISRLLTRSG